MKTRELKIAYRMKLLRKNKKYWNICIINHFWFHLHFVCLLSNRFIKYIMAACKVLMEKKRSTLTQRARINDKSPPNPLQSRGAENAAHHWNGRRAERRRIGAGWGEASRGLFAYLNLNSFSQLLWHHKSFIPCLPSLRPSVFPCLRIELLLYLTA